MMGYNGPDNYDLFHLSHRIEETVMFKGCFSYMITFKGCLSRNQFYRVFLLRLLTKPSS